MTYEVTFHEFHPTRPILRTPSRIQIHSEEEIIERETLEIKKAEHPLSARIRKLPRQCLNFLRDSQSMLLISDFFAIASRSLALAGRGTSAIPYLNIVGSPFYLFHAIAATKERFAMMVTAFHVSQFSDVFFWGGKAVDSLGTTITDIVKPIEGGVAIAGLTTLATVGLIFTTIIPVLLIVFGGIAGFSRGWAMIRTEKTLKEFKQKYRNSSLGEMLDYLHGSKTTGNDAKDALDRKNFTRNYFSNDSRAKGIQKRIEGLLEEHGSEAISGIVQPILQPLRENTQIQEMEEVIELMSEVEGLFGNLLLQQHSAKDLLCLYEQLFHLIDQTEFAEENPDLVAELHIHYERLNREGKELVEIARNDSHRHLTIEATLILAALLTFAAGIMFIGAHQYEQITLSLSLSSYAVTMLYILMDKGISEKNYRQMQQYIQQRLGQTNLS